MNITKVRAPINIALIKYWGKADESKVLPTTTSVSLTLTDLYTETTFKPGPFSFTLNGKPGDFEETSRVKDVLRHFAHQDVQIDSRNNFPTASGLASSASGFAALTFGLNEFFSAQYSLTELANLTRLGSGSSCRSLVDDFAVWHKNGALSTIPNPFKDLMMIVVLVSEAKKLMSSREAMKLTMQTSPAYSHWLDQSDRDFQLIQEAITQVNFSQLGKVMEQNSLHLHQLMRTAQPPIVYQQPESLKVLEMVRLARQQGMEGYATMDAGANVKILFPGKQLSLWEDYLKKNSNHRYLVSRIGGKVHAT
jgi:diphosphomevalonate decarboxylase